MGGEGGKRGKEGRRREGVRRAPHFVLA